jgi:HK97 family phage major capsid protein
MENITLKPHVIDREILLQQAAALISKRNFTHEDNARSSRLMDLAERLGDKSLRSAKDLAFEKAIRCGYDQLTQAEQRDLSVTSSQLGGFLVPAEFFQQLTEAMKAYDRIFDPDVCTRIDTKTGAALTIPSIDDTTASATLISEAVQDPAGPDPTTLSVTMSALNSTYRSGLVDVSLELLQDSAFDIEDLLARSFATRLARGIGKDLVTALLAGATVGAVAVGSSGNTGGSETGGTSVGTRDLIALRKSVNPAYRATQKTFWVMNDNTLASLDSLLDKQGKPIFEPNQTDADGRRLLYGYPVALCPSMPNIGVNNTPIAFGATGYFAVRTVQGAYIRRLSERFADFGKIGFKAFMRCKGAMLTSSLSDSPIKLLQNASS